MPELLKRADEGGWFVFPSFPQARLSHPPRWRGLGARSAWPRSPAPAARQGSRAGQAAGSSLRRSCAFLSSTRPGEGWEEERSAGAVLRTRGPKALHPWDGGQRSWSLWAGPLLFCHLPSATTLPLGLQDNHGPEPFRNVCCPLPGCRGE